MNEISPLVLAAAESAASDIGFKSVVLECCTSLDRERRIDWFLTLIHPNDQMFTHSLREHQDVGAALSQYFNVAAQQFNTARQIIDALSLDIDEASVLDFACGYGRLIRFLVLAKQKETIFASELQSDALEFVANEFGVDVLPSNVDPAMFNPERRFDFIWVTSLFSHLPERLFHDWLKKLYSLLTVDGVLCFSVRDARLLPASEVMPASGFLYQSSSENPDLSTEIYGTTFATEDFVARAMRIVAGDGCSTHRLTRALAAEQDLYLLARNPSRDFGPLAHVRRGTWGWVDRRRLTPSGELYLEGWAGSLDGKEDVSVRVVVNGVAHSLTPAFNETTSARHFRRRTCQAQAGRSGFNSTPARRQSPSKSLPTLEVPRRCCTLESSSSLSSSSRDAGATRTSECEVPET